MTYFIGAHVSIVGGLHKALYRAQDANFQAIQIFTRNPRSWKYSKLSQKAITLFHEAKKQINVKFIISHMPYLPNLASPEPLMHKKSVDSLLAEIERCHDLGIPFLVTHLGHHKGQAEKGWQNLVHALRQAKEKLQDVKTVSLALENTAGEKNSIGSRFEDIAHLMNQLEKETGDMQGFSVCFDTCHAFAAGYDLSSENGVGILLDLLRSLDLEKRISVIHLNDAKMPLGSGKDRHANIGDGFIGLQGFKALLASPLTVNKPLILETPVSKTRNHVDDAKIIHSLLPPSPT